MEEVEETESREQKEEESFVTFMSEGACSVEKEQEKANVKERKKEQQQNLDKARC